MAKVPTADLLIFSNQFASMIRSNLPLLQVLENLALETPQKRLREALEDVCHDVRHGVDLSDALGEHRGIFDSIYVNVVKAGISSGKLGDSLTQMAIYLEKVDDAQRKLRSAMSYPIFMVAAFFVVLNAMVFMILPRFEKMFKSFDKELPAATQWLLDFGKFWQANWHIILAGLASLVIAVVIWLLTEEGRYLWSKWKLEVPVLGRLWRMASLSRFLRTLAVEVTNEVEVLEALSLAASASGNLFIEETILEIADDVERGRSLSDAFRDHDIFEGIVLQMIASGEESSNLDELLMSAANYFDKLLDNEIGTWTALVNPILTVIVGLAIAGMMIAAFLPVFDMGGAMG